MSKPKSISKSSENQMSLFNEDQLNPPPWPEEIVASLGGRMTIIPTPQGPRYCVRDWLYVISGSKSKDINNPFNNWRRSREADGDWGFYSNLTESLPNPDANGRRMDFTSDVGLYEITARMKSNPTVQSILSQMARSTSFADWARRHPFLASEMFAEKAAAQKQLKHDQGVTAYQLAGKSKVWAESRVTTKETQKALNTQLVHTHVERNPDYAQIAGVQNREIFEMTKRQIVEYLDLPGNKADHYRDYLGKYALDAVNLVNEASARKMAKLGRDLTTDEQVSLVREFAQQAAWIMRSAAQLVGVDFVSGAEIDEEGQPKIERRLKLLPGGVE